MKIVQGGVCHVELTGTFGIASAEMGCGSR